MKTLIISDAIGLGILEVRPFPIFQRKYTDLRNKALLSPDYGSMYVAAYLKGRGIDFQVTNLVVDLFSEPGFFVESSAPTPDTYRPASYYEKESAPPIGKAESLKKTSDYFERSLVRESPDVVLFPMSIYNLAGQDLELLKRIKEFLPDVFLVTGGIYATFHAEKILLDGAADFVVRGEGEESALELLSALEKGEPTDGISGISYRKDGKAIHNPERPKIADLDALPHIYTVSEEFQVDRRFSLLKGLNPQEDYIPGAGFLTARGCPEYCTFCLDPAINRGRTRFHSPEYVFRVAEYCYERFADGNPNFYFGDATFTLNRKRFTRMARMLKDVPYAYHIQTRADCLAPEVITTLRESNFKSVAIGAETFNHEVLREVVRKNQEPREVLEATLAVRKEGLLPLLTFIVGLPGESRESVLETVEILGEHGITSASFFPLVVFKGTALYERFIEDREPKDLELCRLNPQSEEFLYLSDEYPTRDSLIGFTEELNLLVKGVRGQSM